MSSMQAIFQVIVEFCDCVTVDGCEQRWLETETVFFTYLTDLQRGPIMMCEQVLFQGKDLILNLED